MDHVGLVDEANRIKHLIQHVLHVLGGEELVRLDDLLQIIHYWLITPFNRTIHLGHVCVHELEDQIQIAQMFGRASAAVAISVWKDHVQ